MCTALAENSYLVFNLHRGDFSTAANVAEAINKIFGNDVAVPLDASSIRVRAPGDLSQRVSFASLVEEVVVEPSTPSYLRRTRSEPRWHLGSSHRARDNIAAHAT